MKARLIKTALFLCLSTFLLLAVGCSKVTKENYGRLKVGQDYAEVVQILGQADECGGALGVKNCRWGDDRKHISVKFAGDKVILFSSQGL